MTIPPPFDSGAGGEAKLLLGCDLARWRSDRIEGEPRELSPHGPEAVRAATLGREGFHNDPADRFIAATALVGGRTVLITDEEILPGAATYNASTSAVKARYPTDSAAASQQPAAAWV